jgi:hypothetical protein
VVGEGLANYSHQMMGDEVMSGTTSKSSFGCARSKVGTGESKGKTPL